MELLDCFDEEEVNGEPDRATPVGVPAEESSGRFARLVADLVNGAASVNSERVLQVVAADGANAIVAKELLRIEHPLEQSLHPMPTHQREQSAFSLTGLLPARYKARQIGSMPQKPVH